jgi:hypothetical protein
MLRYIFKGDPNMQNFRDELRDILTDAITFWEKSRLLYNTVLAVFVVIFGIIGFGHIVEFGLLQMAIIVFMLAVWANILYCLAYVPDVFVQLSGYRDVWRSTYRWILLALGTLLAALFTFATCRSLFL